MVQEIVRDTALLRQPSLPATRKDGKAADDLLATLKAHAAECVGMAANMIGITKRIVAVRTGQAYLLLLNPVITARSPETYLAEEGCLSLDGVRPVRRHAWIEVAYCDRKFKRKFKRKQQRFTGLAAQIVQHEMDHLEGILI